MPTHSRTWLQDASSAFCECNRIRDLGCKMGLCLDRRPILQAGFQAIQFKTRRLHVNRGFLPRPAYQAVDSLKLVALKVF